MNRACNNCASERVVPVLDKRIENRARAGNKFRTRCLHCGHWNPLCSRADFLMSVANDEKDAYVLPADADPEEVDAIVLVDDYDGEIAELNDVHNAAPKPASGDERNSSPTENQFICPADACNAENTGFPDHCPECETRYTWPSEEAA